MRTRIPGLVRGAEALAEAIIGDEADFAIAGSPAVRLDFVNRPGAMWGYVGSVASAGDAVVMVMRGDGPRSGPAEDVARAAALVAGGSVVVAVASVADLKEAGLLATVERTCAAVIDIGVGGRDPLAPALTLTAAWALHVELFAACVRRGETPVVRQSAEIDTRQRRWLRYGEQRFHHDVWLDPIAPGRLAEAYLDRALEVARDLRTASAEALQEAAWRVRDAAARGGMVWLSAGPRAVYQGRYLPGGQADSMRPWAGEAGADDIVIAVGEYDPPAWTWWREIDAMRTAGRGVIWVVAGYVVRSDELADRDVLLDNQAPFGDAAVAVSGYDARLGAVSSLVNELILATLHRAASPVQ